jgi:hypothetical protein
MAVLVEIREVGKKEFPWDVDEVVVPEVIVASLN